MQREEVEEKKEGKSGWLSRNFVGLLVGQYRERASSESLERKGWVSGGCERRVLNLPPCGKYRRTSYLSLYRERESQQDILFPGDGDFIKKKRKESIA